MHVESRPVPEPSAEDQELDLALEQALEVAEALSEAAPRLLLPLSRSRGSTLPELS